MFIQKISSDVNIQNISRGHCIKFGAFNFKKAKTEDIFEKTISDEEKVLAEAIDYVKSTVNLPEPKESAVIIKNNKITDKFLGDKHKVSLGDKLSKEFDKKRNNVIIVHSHSKRKNGLTPPLSYSDFEVILSHKSIKKLYAINYKGEYSMFEKVENKDIDYEDLIMFEETYWNELGKYFESIGKPEFMNLKQSLRDKHVSRRQKEYHEIISQINNFVKKNENTEDMHKFIHNFWQKHAEDFGLEYKTNFSQFNC